MSNVFSQSYFGTEEMSSVVTEIGASLKSANVSLAWCSAKNISQATTVCVYLGIIREGSPLAMFDAGAEHNVEFVARIKEFLALCLLLNQRRPFF